MFSWGQTDFHNFLSGALDDSGPPCRDHFTQQQSRRMHCWSCDVLSGWMAGELVGACSLGDDECAEITQTCCANAGGTFDTQSDCTPGACCLPNGSCSVLAKVSCTDQGGTFHGELTSCTMDCNGETVGNVCSTMNACCLLLTGACIDTTEACCDAQPPSMFCNGCSNGCATPTLKCPQITE